MYIPLQIFATSACDLPLVLQSDCTQAPSGREGLAGDANLGAIRRGMRLPTKLDGSGGSTFALKHLIVERRRESDIHSRFGRLRCSLGLHGRMEKKRGRENDAA